MLRVHAVLKQFDDGYDKVRGVVPAEEPVYGRCVMILDPTINLTGERCQQHDGGIGHDGFHLAREVEHAHLTHVVHGDYKVKTLTVTNHLKCLDSGLHPYDFGRVAQVQRCIVLGNLCLYMSILFKGVAVVVIAYKQDTAYPTGHQLHVTSFVLFHLY